MPKLDGAVAIVTGGGSGLGAAIAETFVGAGAKTFVADIDEAAADEVTTRIGAGCVSVRLDVTDPRSISAMVDLVVEQAGKIDILVNCAGVYGMQPWLRVTEEDFDRIFSVNVRGLLFVTQAVAARMVDRGSGTIINVASATGRRGNPMSVAYSASKMAVINLTQSAALAFARFGIRVNAIAPGLMRTPMFEQVSALYDSEPGAGDLLASVVESVPLERISSPKDQVGAVLFLATDDSAYITGQTLNVDGGLFLN